MDFPGEKLVSRLIDLFDDTVRGFAKPWQISRIAAAEAKADLHKMMSQEQGKQNVQLVREGKAAIDEAGCLIPQENQDSQIPSTPEGVSNLNALLQVVQKDSTLSELEHLGNILQDFQWAIDAAKEIPDEEVSDEPVDPDWFARWRTWAQDVSSETMQRMWGRVLAGEVQRPGTYSMHTLDVLSRLSRRDAKLVEKAASFVIDDFVFTPTNLDNFGLSHLDCLALIELGILNAVDSQGTVSLDQKDAYRLYYCQTKIVKVTSVGQNVSITFKAHLLTLVGRELCKLRPVPANEEYLREFARLLKSDDVKVEMGNWQPWRDSNEKIETFDLEEI